MPGRHASSGDYRYGFNGQEKDDEVNGVTGSSYTAEYWQYDSRLGRRWNIDPVDKPWMSSYHAFSNKPITNVDPNGAYDKFYNKKGNLVYDDGVGNDSYIVSQKKFDEAVAGNGGTPSVAISDILRSGGLKAYSTEVSAAKAWAKGGFDATKIDGKERAASILQARGSDGNDLFVLGGTTVGDESSVNPRASRATVGGEDLLSVTFNTWHYSIHRKYTDRNAPPLVWFWGAENPIVSQGWNSKSHNTWAFSGFTHTHPKDNKFSVSGKVYGKSSFDLPFGGDMGYAVNFNVYLVPAKQTVLTHIFLQPKHGNTYFGGHTSHVHKYGEENKVKIPHNGK